MDWKGLWLHSFIRGDPWVSIHSLWGSSQMNRCLFIWNCGTPLPVAMYEHVGKCLVNMKRGWFLVQKWVDRVLQWTYITYFSHKLFKDCQPASAEPFYICYVGCCGRKHVVSQLQEDIKRQITSHPTTHSLMMCDDMLHRAQKAGHSWSLRLGG